MELFQYIILPLLIIFPALIAYAVLINIVPVNRVILAIISGVLGGIIYGHIFAGKIHTPMI